MGETQTITREELRDAFFRSFPPAAIAIILGAIDQTITATALPAIAAELGSLDRISWVVVAYLVAATIAAPVYGRLGDAFGRRRMLLAGLGILAIGACASASATSLTGLILGRVLQGLGGGGLLTSAMALIGEAVPPRERGRFQAYIAGSFMVANVLGPSVGGWLTQGFGWRAVFLAMLPGVALATVLTLRLPFRPGRRGTLFRFDALGVLLFAGCIGPALLALSLAQRMSLEALPAVAGMALLAILCFVLLLRQERRAADPLLPLDVLGEATIWRCNLLAGCVAGALVGMVSFLPIYLYALRGVAPGQAGLLLLPLSVCGGFGAMAAGRALARTGWTLRWPSIGLPIATTLLIVTAFTAEALPVLGLTCALGAVAIGFGTSYPIVQTTVQVAAGQARLGAASASVQFARTLGAAAGTALLGAVLFGTLALGDAQAAALFGRLVREGAQLAATLPPADLAALQAGLAGAFRAAFLAAAVLAAIATVLAWRVPLRRV